MKKRFQKFLSLLLTLSFCLGAFAFSFPAQAADESLRAMTAYDALYVGADGSTTRNGGMLTALYTAFTKEDPSVDLAKGVWYNKVGKSNITVYGRQKSVTNATGWIYGENGGFGYRDPKFSAAETYLLGDISLLKDQFEVETVSAIHLRDLPMEYDLLLNPHAQNKDGRKIYSMVGTSNWKSHVTATITFKAAPKTTFTPAYAASATSFEEQEPSFSNGKTLTTNENGTVTVTYNYLGKYVSISVPEHVTVSSIQLPKVTANSEACSQTAFVFSSLHLMTWSNLSGSNVWKNGFGLTRYYISTTPWNGGGQNSITSRDNTSFAKNNGKVTSLRVTLDDAGYTAMQGNETVFTTPANKIPDIVRGSDFRLFHNLPSDVYAVRVYSTPLTQDERNVNHLVDLLAYAKIDPKDFSSLDRTAKASIAAQMTDFTFSDDAESIRTALRDLLNNITAGVGTEGNHLYVTDGLVGLYTAYETFASAIITSEDAIILANNQNASQSIQLIGNGWKKNQNGGFTIERTASEWKTDHNFGIRLSYDQLPNDDYTVELSVNPFGIHTIDENGNKTRYVDDVSAYGTYDQYGFILGPLRAMTFASLRPKGLDGQLEKRWTYLTEGCWNKWCNTYGATPCVKDDGWGSIGENAVVSYAITLDEIHQTDENDVIISSSADYSFYNNAIVQGSFSVPSNKLAFLDKTAVKEQRFELFNHVPGTVYAVRIYDRVLNADELLQNRIADMIYYYGIDASLYTSLLAQAEDTALFLSLFSDIRPGLTKEEAQRAFDDILLSVFLTFDGIGIRKDPNVQEGMRYYFDLSDDAISAAEALGYSMEIGAVVNVGKSEAPVLSEGAYDHLIKAYSSETPDEKHFFMDEDTFAVTVLYNPPAEEKYAVYTEAVEVRAYLCLTAPDGKRYTYYTETNADDGTHINCLYIAYHLMEDKAKEEPLASHLKDVLSEVRNEVVFLVSEKDCTLKEAAALAQKAMEEATMPLKVILRIASGVQCTDAPVTISGAAFQNPYAKLIIEGEDESATLSALASIDMTESESVGKNVYRCRFSKDARGKYPDFRYLYIDGKLIEPASVGALRAATDAQSHIRFDKTHEGKFYLPAELAEPLRAEYGNASNVKTCLSGENILMHIVAQWDYNMVHLYGVDFKDSRVDSYGKTHYAVYVSPEEYAKFCLPSGNSVIDRPVYLTGSEAFMDEENEFYYDAKTGTLLLYAENGVASKSVAYPLAENLLILEDIIYTTVQNLRFTGTDDVFLSKNGHTGGQSGKDSRFADFPDRAALLLKNSRGLTVSNCVFEELPCEGISGRGRLENIAVQNSVFQNIGSAALRLGNPVRYWTERYGIENVTVENNIFHEIAYVYRNSSALHFASAKDLTVHGNTVGGCSYSAISLGWHWSEVSWSAEQAGQYDAVNLYNVTVSQNYIYDFMTEMADGGAIYTLGGNLAKSEEGYLNTIRENYIVFSNKAGNGLGGMVCGIYLDACSSHWEIESNVIAEQSALADVENTPAFLRRRGTHYVYLQHLTSAPSYRNLCKDNVIIGVRASKNDPDYTADISAQKYEVYRKYLAKDRYLFEQGTVYVEMNEAIPQDVTELIGATGADGENGDASLLLTKDY